MEIARLGLVIDPTGAVKGKDAGVAAAAALAKAMEDAARRIEDATKKMGDSARKGGEEVDKSGDKAKSGFQKIVNAAKGMAGGVGSAFQNVMSSLAMMRGGLAGHAMVIGQIFTAIIQKMQAIVKQAVEVGQAAQGIRALGAAAKAAAVGIASLTVILAAVVSILLPLIAAVYALQTAFGVIADGVDLSANLETYEIQFANLLGSFELAQKKMAELAHFADTTPFDLPEVVKASITLEAMGRGALSGADTLRMVGDAAAKANVPFDDLGVTIGRLYANLKAGATAGVELNRLSDIGLLAPDIKLALMELSESANEGGKNFTKLWALVESELKKAKGSTELMALSYKGLVSNMSAAWDRFKVSMGEPFRDALKPLITDLTGLIDKMTERVLEMRPAITAALDEVVYAFRVMQQDDGFGVAMRAGIETALQVLERGLQACGEIAKDVLARAAFEFIKFMEKANQAGFWDGLSTALYNAAVDFTNVIIDGVNKAVGKANDIAKILIPIYGITSKAVGGGGGLIPGLEKRLATAATTGEAPKIRSFGEVYNSLPQAPTTAAQQDYANRRQTEVERLAAERATGKDNSLVTLGAPTTIPADLASQLGGSKKKGGGGGQSEFDKMKGDAERVISDIATPQEELDKQLASLQKLRDAGLLTAEQFQRAVAKGKEDYVSAMESMAKASEDAANRNKTALGRLMADWGNLKKNIDEANVGIANSVADNITGSLVAMMDGSKSAKEAFADMAKSIVADILQITMRLMVQYAIQAALGMVIGTPTASVAVPVAHDGGEVGGVRRRRAVGAGAFNGAMRYHTGGQVGLKPGEEPAILEKGETVLNKEDTAAMKKRLTEPGKPASQAGGQAVTILNYQDPRQVQEFIATNPGIILNVIAGNLPAVRRLITQG